MTALLALFRSWYPLLLLAWALLLGMRARSSGGIPPDAGYWDAVIATQTDLYLLFFGIIPIWLLAIGLSFPQGSAEIWLVREGSRTRRLARWSARTFGSALLTAVIPALAGLSVASGLPMTGTWSSGTLEAGVILAAAGIPPLAALITQVVLLSLSLTTVAVIAFVLRERWASPTGTVTILTAMFIALLLLGGGEGSSAVPLSAIFLMYMHGSSGSVLGTIFLLVICVLGLWGLSWMGERRVVQLPPAARSALLALAGLTSIMLTHALPLASESFTLADVLRRAFMGGDLERVSPLGFTSYGLVFTAGALWIGMRTMQHDRDRLPLLAVRHGRLDRWGYLVLLRIVIGSACLVTALLLVSAAVSLPLGARLLSDDLGALLVVVGGIGTLQIVFLAMLFASTMTISAEPRTVLIVLAVTLFLAMPPVNRGHVFPVGLSLTGELAADQLRRDLLLMSAATAVSAIAALLLTRIPSVQKQILGRTP